MTSTLRDDSEAPPVPILLKKVDYFEWRRNIENYLSSHGLCGHVLGIFRESDDAKQRAKLEKACGIILCSLAGSVAQIVEDLDHPGEMLDKLQQELVPNTMETMCGAL